MSHVTSQNSQEFNAYLESTSVHKSPDVNGNADNTLKNCSGSGDTQIFSNDILDNGSLQVVSTVPPINGSVDANSDLGLNEIHENSATWRIILWKIGVYAIAIGILVPFLMGVNMSWTAITAALVLVILDFKDARPCLEKVSYSLLVFFCGMFITVEGFNRTGVPSAIWDFIEPYAQIDHISGVAILAVVIVVLSNLASNVPTVLLLGARIAAAAATLSHEKEKKAWLILAWVSTVAGNLSILGSAANLIVCEQARNAQNFGYNLTFWAHLKFGIPSTIIVIAIGLIAMGISTFFIKV